MARLAFAKLHGTGNDFLYVDGCTELPAEPAALARRLCARTTGVGADGLVVLRASRVADLRMELYNADGSRAEMSGNGIRGLAKFVYDAGHCRANPMRVETDAGVKTLWLDVCGGRVARVTVDMGVPVFAGPSIPIALDGEAIDYPLEVEGKEFRVTCLSVGNPHCVVFWTEDLESLPLSALGPHFEHHPFFPARVNTEFVRIDGDGLLTMRVWERGAGETLSCGTGACAAVAAGARTGRTRRRATVRLAGGELAVEWRSDGHLLLSGDAVKVCEGTAEV